MERRPERSDRIEPSDSPRSESVAAARSGLAVWLRAGRAHRGMSLDEGEALRRYAACGLGTQDLTPTVRALVEAMSDLAPGSATTVRATPRKLQAVEVIDPTPCVRASPIDRPRAGTAPAEAVVPAETGPLVLSAPPADATSDAAACSATWAIE